MSLTVEQAQRVLGHVHEDHVFWLSNGESVRGLEELAKRLPQLSDDVYQHHVTADRNDFANWIEGVFEDADLAQSLRHTTSKKQAANLIRLELGRVKRLIEGASSPKIIEHETFDFAQPKKKKRTKKKRDACHMNSEHADMSSPAPGPRTSVPQEKQEEYQDEEDHASLPKMPEYLGRDVKEEITEVSEGRNETQAVPLPPPPPPVRAFPDEKSGSGGVDTALEQSDDNAALEQEVHQDVHQTLHPRAKVHLGPDGSGHDAALQELLQQQQELDDKEGKLLEIEKRIEERYHTLRAAHHKFFSREYMYGVLTGTLVVLIIVALVLKLAFPGCLPI